MAEIHCRHFNGYKPCGKNDECTHECPHFSRVQERILLIHLEALGAVLRSTALLPAIRRKYPRSHITWVTKKPAHALLENNDLIDRVLTTDAEDLLKLAALEFDFTFVVDKSLVAAGVLRHTTPGEIRGFRADPVLGAIVPANREAEELWHLGLSDTEKFFRNKKSETELVHGALALGPFARDEYHVPLTAEEKALAESRRELWGGGRMVLGLNTGCSGVLKHKKLTVEGHRRLIGDLLGHSKLKHCSIVLLGGPEDKERNHAIAQGLPVIESPTTLGLRDGLASVEACDLVFSGDSLGMHMAIALKKWVVAWFGPSCLQEIDLYDRGVKISTSASCSPCWKRVCQKPVMCYDQVDFRKVTYALDEGLDWLTSSSKPHFQETSSSPSHC